MKKTLTDILTQERARPETEWIILSNAITNDSFIKIVYDRYKSGNLSIKHFSPYAQHIIKWILSYFKNHQKAPKSTIEAIYIYHKESLNNEVASIIENYLENLADEHARAEENGIDIDWLKNEVLPSFIKEQGAELLKANIDHCIEQEKYDDIEKAINKYSDTTKHIKEIETYTAKELSKIDFPEPQFTIPNIISEGLTILAGKPKRGKSILATNICVDIAYGRKVMSSIKVNPCEVIYYALEDNWRRLKSRVNLNINKDGRSKGKKLQLYIDCPKIGMGGIERIRFDALSKKNLKLIIIDTFQKIKGFNRYRISPYEHDYNQAGILKALADELKVPILVIHHLRKNETEDDIMDDVSGTTGLTGAADSILVFQRKPDDENAYLHVVGRDIERAEYALKFNKPLLYWEMEGKTYETANSKTELKIFNCIKQHQSIKADEIVSITKISRATVFRCLNKLANVLNNKKGSYSIK